MHEEKKLEKVIRIVGVDPGFATLGLACVEVSCVGKIGAPRWVETSSRILEVVAIKTVASGRKEKRNDEDVRRRLSEIVDTASRFFTEYRPALVAFESAALVRSSTVSQKIGLGWGGVFALVRTAGAAVEVYDPMELKVGCGLKKSASKLEVQKAVEKTWAVFTDWPRMPKKKTIVEHAADAAGVVLTAMQGEQFRGFWNVLAAT